MNWIKYFLENGTKNGCGDLSIMVGIVNSIITEAENDVRTQTIRECLAEFHEIDTEREGVSEWSMAETFSTKLEAFDYGQEQYRKDVLDKLQALLENNE